MVWRAPGRCSACFTSFFPSVFCLVPEARRFGPKTSIFTAPSAMSRQTATSLFLLKCRPASRGWTCRSLTPAAKTTPHSISACSIRNAFAAGAVVISTNSVSASRTQRPRICPAPCLPARGSCSSESLSSAKATLRTTRRTFTWFERTKSIPRALSQPPSPQASAGIAAICTCIPHTAMAPALVNPERWFHAPPTSPWKMR